MMRSAFRRGLGQEKFLADVGFSTPLEIISPIMHSKLSIIARFLSPHTSASPSGHSGYSLSNHTRRYRQPTCHLAWLRQVKLKYQGNIGRKINVDRSLRLIHHLACNEDSDGKENCGHLLIKTSSFRSTQTGKRTLSFSEAMSA